MEDLNAFVDPSNHTPQFANGLLIDHIEERLRFAKTLRDRVRHEGPKANPALLALSKLPDAADFDLNLMQLAACMFTEYDWIHNRRWAPEHEDISAIITNITSTESFLGTYLQSQSIRVDPVSFDSENPPPHHSNAPPGGKDKARSEPQKALVTERDGDACAFSHEPDPDKCHWWPFASTKNRKKFRETRQVLMQNLLSLKNSLQEDLLELIVPTDGELAYDLVVSDMAWNIVSMAPGTHRYLGNAYFALKWLGSTGESVRLERDGRRGAVEYAYYRVQWFWMPASIHDSIQSHIRPDGENLQPRRRVKLDSDADIESLASRIEQSFARRHKQFSTKRATVRDEVGRLIESGRVFTLKVDKRDLYKTETVIKASWLASRMAAFSGAAEVWDQLDSQPPPDIGSALFVEGPTIPLRPSTTVAYDEAEGEAAVEAKDRDEVEGIGEDLPHPEPKAEHESHGRHDDKPEDKHEADH